MHERHLFDCFPSEGVASAFVFQFVFFGSVRASFCVGNGRGKRGHRQRPPFNKQGEKPTAFNSRIQVTSLRQAIPTKASWPRFHGEKVDQYYI